jgi:hypothetical protein
MSGSCWDPVQAAEGIPCTDADSEPQEPRHMRFMSVPPFIEQ